MAQHNFANNNNNDDDDIIIILGTVETNLKNVVYSFSKVMSFSHSHFKHKQSGLFTQY